MSGDPERARRAAVVMNPTKFDDARELREEVTAGMLQAGWETPLWLETTAEDPGYGMADKALAEGVARVLACGGDGTVRAVLTVLAGTGTPMGVLPAGTGNLLARNLGLPIDDLAQALQVALTGAVRSIDVGRIEPGTADARPERFAVMAGVGFDAQMMRDAPSDLKSSLGWPAYLISAAKNLRGPSIPLEVRLDDNPPIRATARTVVVTNLAALPGGVDLLPDTSPDDGTLDVAIIESHNLIDWARVASRVLTRRTSVDDLYSTHHAQHVQISMSSPHPRQADGDLLDEANHMEVHIEPGALLLMVPATSD